MLRAEREGTGLQGLQRVVSAEQIAQAPLSLNRVFEIVAEGFELCGRGEVECPPKIGVHPRPGAFTHVMPVYVPAKDLSGIKIISVYPDNAEHQLPTTAGFIVMLDPGTGLPTSMLDAAWITSARTAMVSMLDVTYLAKPNPVFGIVGATGVTGRAHIDAIGAVFPGSRVLVHSRDDDRLDSLLRDYLDSSCELVPAGSDEAVVRGSDVTIVCTSFLATPILKPEWLHPGQNVVNVHMRGWPRDVLAHVDLVSCDDRRPLVGPTSGVAQVYEGLDPDVELGEVVVGAHPGRVNPDQIIFSFNYGLAVFDILVADYVLHNI